MRLISPYSAAVSDSPVRNQVAPRASHSSTSSNSARMRSLATPRILSSYTRGRFVTSPVLSCGRSHDYRLGVTPGHHPGITRGRVNLAAPAHNKYSQICRGHRGQSASAVRSRFSDHGLPIQPDSLRREHPPWSTISPMPEPGFNCRIGDRA
jgi:hypothetical protein